MPTTGRTRKIMKRFIEWTNKVEAMLLAKKYLGVSLYTWLVVSLSVIAILLAANLHFNLKAI
jgi:hypothetical protein